MTNTKLNQEIEENCWAYMEVGAWTKCYEYLKSLGFDNEEIEMIYEHWREGKSFYPYN